MGRAKSLENTLMLGKNAGKRRVGQQRMACLDGITDSVDMSLSKLQEITGGQRSLACYNPWGRKESDRTQQLNNSLKKLTGFPGGTGLRTHRPMQETWVRSLGQEDSLEKRMAYSLQYSCLENSMDRESSLAGYSPWGHKRVGHDSVTKQQQEINTGAQRGINE